ncbi:MAG: hypothetical protein WAN11_19595 [Syntrophobacteraceae bacterium]
MTIIVEAALDEVQTVIDTEINLKPIANALELRQSALPPPRRSLEELPSIITVVEFLGTSLATNIAYDVGKKLLFDVLARHFGKDKVREEPKELAEKSSPKDPGDS